MFGFREVDGKRSSDSTCKGDTDSGASLPWLFLFAQRYYKRQSSEAFSPVKVENLCMLPLDCNDQSSCDQLKRVWNRVRFLFPTLPMTVWYCPFTFVFFKHLKPIWFEKCFYLNTKGKQRNIYGKTFNPVSIAHHQVVQYKILSSHRYILIIIFGAFRWRMTKTGLLSQY